MATISANTYIVPVFLEADNKKDLMVKMLLTNKLNVSKFNYMPPLLEGKKWVVWFYADLRKYQSVEDLSEKDKEAIGGLDL